ncbi:hypothetical protein [Microvirga makkahensis]|uniref:Uncharacterized protein n=1 Tax=Microvirga makkahensis TaxID=1128670 RepID=A0A7X3MQ63_9HYPH|nr:hypothetical protein [Microvirga makkahensis]MXQ11187.1 hypothetical protein [Microvirga makkahensis]
MDITPSRIFNGFTSSRRVEHGAEITFIDAPQPWRDGDMVVVEFPSNEQTNLIVTEHEGALRFSWRYRDSAYYLIDLDKVDDRTFRVRLQPQHIEIQEWDDERDANAS